MLALRKQGTIIYAIFQKTFLSLKHRTNTAKSSELIDSITERVLNVTAKNTKARLTFVTRYYPPDPNINGESVWDMVKYLKEKYGTESNIICINRTSDGGGAVREPAGNVVRIAPFSVNKSKFARFFLFLYDGYRLVKAAKKRFSNTVIICTTSPPLLPFWANMTLSGKVKWGIWFFDLFPESFGNDKTAIKNNFIYKWVLGKTYRHSPDFLIALGPRQAEFLLKKYNNENETAYSSLPCGVFYYQEKNKEKPKWWEQGKIILGYCGNLGAAHNPKFLKAVIDNINPEKYRLVLSLYGVHSEKYKTYAANKPGIVFTKRLQRGDLHFIDIHMVTLREEWTHLAVPSKAVSAISSGSTFMFSGSEDSDNWQLLQDAGWFIQEGSYKNMAAQLQTCFEDITPAQVIEKRKKAAMIAERLKQYVSDTYAFVEKQAII